MTRPLQSKKAKSPIGTDKYKANLNKTVKSIKPAQDPTSPVKSIREDRDDELRNILHSNRSNYYGNRQRYNKTHSKHAQEKSLASQTQHSIPNNNLKKTLNKSGSEPKLEQCKLTSIQKYKNRLANITNSGIKNRGESTSNKKSQKGKKLNKTFGTNPEHHNEKNDDSESNNHFEYLKIQTEPDTVEVDEHPNPYYANGLADQTNKKILNLNEENQQMVKEMKNKDDMIKKLLQEQEETKKLMRQLGHKYEDMKTILVESKNFEDLESNPNKQLDREKLKEIYHEKINFVMESFKKMLIDPVEVVSNQGSMYDQSTPLIEEKSVKIVVSPNASATQSTTNGRVQSLMVGFDSLGPESDNPTPSMEKSKTIVERPSKLTEEPIVASMNFENQTYNISVTAEKNIEKEKPKKKEELKKPLKSMSGLNREQITMHQKKKTEKFVADKKPLKPIAKDYRKCTVGPKATTSSNKVDKMTASAGFNLELPNMAEGIQYDMTMGFDSAIPDDEKYKSQEELSMEDDVGEHRAAEEIESLSGTEKNESGHKFQILNDQNIVMSSEIPGMDRVQENQDLFQRTTDSQTAEDMPYQNSQDNNKFMKNSQPLEQQKFVNENNDDFKFIEDQGSQIHVEDHNEEIEKTAIFGVIDHYNEGYQHERQKLLYSDDEKVQVAIQSHMANSILGNIKEKQKAIIRDSFPNLSTDQFYYIDMAIQKEMENKERGQQDKLIKDSKFYYHPKNSKGQQKSPKTNDKKMDLNNDLSTKNSANSNRKDYRALRMY